MNAAGSIRMWLLTGSMLLCGASGCTDADRPDASASNEVLSQIPYRPGIPVALDPVPAPQFERLTADGNTFRMADHRGRVVLVNFWATWCAPCVKEIPDLISIDAALRDSGLTILGVSMDHDGFQAVRPFLERFSPPYPIVLDEGLAAEFGGVYGLPASFLVDRRGQLVRRIDGLAHPEPLRSEIRKLLADVRA